MITSYSKLNYEDRLDTDSLHLTSLETRRLRGDTIEVFKIGLLKETDSDVCVL